MEKLTLIMLILLCVMLFRSSPNAIPREPITSPILQGKDLKITIVYDNNHYDDRLETRWGFSCYIKGAEKTILFDVGGEGQVLLSNMEKLNIDPKEVNLIFLSHVHYDHNSNYRMCPPWDCKNSEKGTGDDEIECLTGIRWISFLPDELLEA